MTIGFVTHAQGNPFVEQIVDGAKAAAADLGVTLKVQESPGGSPESQLKLSQGLANAGAAGVATSMPGDGMAKGMNEIADSGVPTVQFNMLSKAMKGTYVGEKSVQSGRVLGKMVVDKLGGASAKGKVVIGICFPGFPVLENRAKGVEESLKAAPGLTALGPFDVKVSAVDNYNHWEQLYAANPDVVAMIGLCAPDIASLGKLNAAHGDKFVAGGYDLTGENLAAIKGGHAYVSIGQSPFVQGYLPVVLLVEAIKAKKPTPTGFLRRRHPDRHRRQRRHGAGPAQGEFRRTGEARQRSQGDGGVLQALDADGARRRDASGIAAGRGGVAIRPHHDVAGFACANCASATAASRRSTASTSTSRPAPSTPSSARTAPASRP